MSDKPTRWTQDQVEQTIGNLLRIGLLVAGVVVLIGGIVYLIRHGREPINYTQFKGEPSGLTSIPAIIQSVLAFKARGIIQLGLILLVATPLARVVFSLIAFAIQRDKIYVAITLIVLIILSLSVLGIKF